MTSYARPRVRDIPNTAGTRAAALADIAADEARRYGSTSVYDAKDILTTTQQTLRNRTNYAATAAQRGSTAGVDTNDPLFLPHTSGTDYVYLPGTAGNSITFPRPFATTHFTITRTDASVVTGTTTANPVVIGDVAHSGSVVSVVLRETDGAGSIAENLVVTNGLTGWTVNRSATGFKTAVVTRPVILLDGTDDYVQLPASDTPTFTATTGKHTVLALVRGWNVPNIGGQIYSSYSAPDDGIGLYYNTEVYARVGASGTALQLPSTATALQDGRLTVVGFVVDDGTVAVYKDDDGLSVAADFSAGGTITHAVPRFGSAAHSTSGSIDIEGFACLTFQDQAKTETELNAIAAQLLAGAYA